MSVAVRKCRRARRSGRSLHAAELVLEQHLVFPRGRPAPRLARRSVLAARRGIAVRVVVGAPRVGRHELRVHDREAADRPRGRARTGLVQLEIDGKERVLAPVVVRGALRARGDCGRALRRVAVRLHPTRHVGQRRAGIVETVARSALVFLQDFGQFAGRPAIVSPFGETHEEPRVAAGDVSAAAAEASATTAARASRAVTPVRREAVRERSSFGRLRAAPRGRRNLSAGDGSLRARSLPPVVRARVLVG